MIIKQQHKGTTYWKYLLSAVGFLIVAGIAFKALPQLFSSTSLVTFEGFEKTLLCDAENVSGNSFVTGGVNAKNAHTQSSEQHYSGVYSSKVDSSQRYGMTVEIPVNPNVDVSYLITVRRYTISPKTNGLYVNAKNDPSLNFQTSTSTGRDDQGWELLKLKFKLPKDKKIDHLLVFPFAFEGSSDPAYFDDLTIEILPNKTVDKKSVPQLAFYLDNKAVRKINTKRNEAIRKGILKSADDDWVKAKLRIDGREESTEVRLRLKGDWVDHLQGDYWSYRVKMPSNRSWNRLQTFSLQDPKTRFYLHEWLYHKALEEQDILTPRYGFVRLRENTKPEVLYAYEEHFDKQIAEYKERREGVIIKFDEEFHWDQQLREKEKFSTKTKRLALSSSEVLPFKSGKTIASPKLLEQFEQASSLLNAFKHKTAPVGDIFDIDRLAKYFAITEAFSATHGLAWHNLRFYYNPITRKLEPIGFDGYTETGPYKNYPGKFFGEFKSSEKDLAWQTTYSRLFQDDTFASLYSSYLLKFTALSYWEALQARHKADLDRYETLLDAYIEGGYTFDLTTVLNRCRLIRDDIIPYANTSIKVYKEVGDAQAPKFWATNHHSLPLSIIGGALKSGGDLISSSPQFVNSNQQWAPNSYTELSLPKEAKFVCYKLPGLDSVFYSAINRWKRPDQPLIIRYSTASNLQLPLSDSAYTLIDSVVTIRAGAHQISSPIIVPKGYSIHLSPGTAIDLTKRAYLLSYGTFYSNGTKDAPVSITSSDRTAQGVAILGAPDICKVSYTSFTHLNTLEENEWQLTGAVTFYETEVDFNRVTIADNSCEDALNLVRSKFEIVGLNISNTFADGFDGDFCRGTLSDSYFYRTGNDGLDFSGSWVDIKNVELNEIGDKGVSAGEEAHLKVTDVKVDNAQIGVASKDLSTVDVAGLTLSNCPQGFAAYRKKPEFGGGTITIASYTADKVERLYNADSESTIKRPN